MRKFESYLICIVFIIAGSFIGNIITKPSTANAVEIKTASFTPNQLELPLNIDISRTGKVNVQNALNRTVSVNNNSLSKVVIRWRTKYRYFPIYITKWKTVSRSIHRHDSIDINKNLDTLGLDSLIRACIIKEPI
jgi:hypothetical protein